MDRKQRYYKLLMASCLSIAVACTADIGGTGEADMGKMAILTRSELTATSAQFVQGDKVWVWATTTGETPTSYFDAWLLTADADRQLTGSTRYWPEEDQSLKVKAVHGNFGALQESATPWSGSFTHTIATDQTQGNGYSSSDLLYCPETTITKDAENKLNFKHLLSKLTLAIDLSQCEGITAADLNGTEVWLKSVKPEASFNTANGTVADNATGTETDIKVGVISGLDANGSTPIDIAVGIVPPQTFTAGTKMVMLSLPSGHDICLLPNSDVPFLSGNAYTLTMKITRKIVSGNIDVDDFDDSSELIRFEDGTGYIVQISLGCEITVAKFDDNEYHTIVFDTDTPVSSRKAIEVTTYESDGEETINITEETQQQE